MANKRYEINLPVDGQTKRVVYTVSGVGVITIERVDGVHADNLPASSKSKIIAAIKASAHPGNELPEAPDAGTKPVDPDAPVDPGYGRPGVPDVNPNPNLDPDVDKDAPRPDQELPDGPPPAPETPDNELPEAPEPKA